MSLHIQFNEINRRFELYLNENLLTSYDSVEQFDTAMEQLKKSGKDAKAHLISDTIDFKEKIHLEYLEMDVESAGYEMNEIIGLEINIYWDGDAEWNKSNVFALTNDDNKINIIQGLENNFSPNQVYQGQTSTFQIQKCLGEDLQEYIQKNTDFKFVFCGEEIQTTDLFNKTQAVNYGFLPPNNKKEEYYNGIGNGFSEVGSEFSE